MFPANACSLPWFEAYLYMLRGLLAGKGTQVSKFMTLLWKIAIKSSKFNSACEEKSFVLCIEEVDRLNLVDPG